MYSDKKTHTAPAPLNTDGVRKQLESLELTDAQRQFLESVLKNEPADKSDDTPAGEHDEEGPATPQCSRSPGHPQ